MGLRQERDRTPAYDELIQEFFDACHDKYGRQVEKRTLIWTIAKNIDMYDCMYNNWLIELSWT